MFDDIFDAVGGTPGRVVGLGLALGAGVMLGRGVRPVARAALRGWFNVADRVREYTAEASESMQDLYAEARSEYDQGGEQEAKGKA
jgi:hypothetical protein